MKIQRQIIKIAMAKVLKGSIACKKSELDLGITLKGGQSFRWKAIEDGGKYRGVFGGKVWTLHQDEANVYFTVHSPTSQDVEKYEAELIKYFNLHLSLAENLQKWSELDVHFKKFTDRVQGVRILQQDVVENVFSFICSANNNIIRITGMVDKMCKHFGRKICQVDKQNYHEFPTIEALAADKVQATLAKEGFGYRAPFIANSAKKLVNLGGRAWLETLCKDHGANYEDARNLIQVLPGVGPKVADCICLMSLGHLEAIPVDTHIYQVARETYLPHIKKVSSVTPVIYNTVNKHLRETWGPLAGWAQTVVFCTRIKSPKRDNTENIGPPKRRKQ